MKQLGNLNPADLVDELEIGEITIKDIIDDLMKPEEILGMNYQNHCLSRMY